MNSISLKEYLATLPPLDEKTLELISQAFEAGWDAAENQNYSLSQD